MKDETYAFISDVKEKKVTARSARHTRTHCGKGGRVRLPSDNLSKKELMKMSGECKSYRLNAPMSWAEFKAMPDDIQIAYVKLLRQKFNVPDKKLAEMFGTSKDGISFRFKKLGISMGKCQKRKNWDSEGFYAWLHGVDKLPTPVIEEIPCADPNQVEPETYVEDDLPVEEPDPCCCELNTEDNALPIQFDDYLKVVEELNAVHEKDKAEIAWLRNECESLRMNARILEAQMEVVRMIFGGKNNG